MASCLVSSVLIVSVFHYHTPVGCSNVRVHALLQPHYFLFRFPILSHFLGLERQVLLAIEKPVCLFVDSCCYSMQLYWLFVYDSLLFTLALFFSCCAGFLWIGYE